VNSPRKVSQKEQMASMAYAGVVIFFGTLLLGVLVMIVFSASACLLSRVNRCFSISRDLTDVTLGGLKIWSSPALAVALLLVAIGRIRGAVAWWNVLFVSYLVLAILVVRSVSDLGSPETLLASVLLFICAQLTLSMGRWVGGLQI